MCDPMRKKVFSVLWCLGIGLSLSFLTLALPRIFSDPSKDAPLTAFAKHPVWNAEKMDAAPVDIGFATADFQDNGPEMHHKTNWGVFYRNNAEKLGNLEEMPDVWNYPQRVIARLNQLHCKKLRFSISRDKIEPHQGEPFDVSAIEHYRQFFRELKAHGIEPMVTLNHFSDPTYFSWERKEDIEGFVRYAEAVSDLLYEEGVRKIITINEPTVIAFQGWIMGEFPPHKTGDFKGAGVVLEHMMHAHTLTYKALKVRHPEFQIGISHNPIRFRYFHKVHPIWSPIERLICHYLTEINHSALMRYFQSGKFSLSVPFLGKHAFESASKPPMDFIGIQYYTDPLLKLSLTKAESVTRVPGEKLTSYQYRIYPQGLASILEEANTLGVPIDLTEIGIDTGINVESTDQERIAYFDKIFQVVQMAKEQAIPVRSLYFWTLTDNLEWYKAWAVRFGFYSFDPANGEAAPRPASLWIKERITARNEQLPKPAEESNVR